MRVKRWVRLMPIAVLVVVAAALAAAVRSDARVAADPGVDVGSKTITVGGYQIATGANASFIATTNAVKAIFAMNNAKGGVNGWKINYIAPDTGGDPTRSLQEIRNQIEGNQVFAIVWGPGSPANQQVVPYVVQSGVPYVPPGESGDPYVGKSYPNVFPVIPPYSSMAIYMAQWGIKHLKAKKIALVYENDAVGQPVHDRFKDYVESHNKGVKVVAEIPYQITDTDLTAVGRALADAKPDIVVNWGTAGPTVKSKAAAMANGLNVPWFNPYFLADPSVIKLDVNTMEGSYFNYYLRPFFSNDKSAKEYRTAMGQYGNGSPAGGLALNGWAGASVFVEALRQITAGGKTPTRAALINALDKFKNKQIGVIPGVSYSKNVKQGVSSSYLIRFKNRRFTTVALASALPVVK
jgi:branched-chain amino acid transport system substrate-binding protein